MLEVYNEALRDLLQSEAAKALDVSPAWAPGSFQPVGLLFRQHGSIPACLLSGAGGAWLAARSV